MELFQRICLRHFKYCNLMSRNKKNRFILFKQHLWLLVQRTDRSVFCGLLGVKPSEFGKGRPVHHGDAAGVGRLGYSENVTPDGQSLPSMLVCGYRLQFWAPVVLGLPPTGEVPQWEVGEWKNVDFSQTQSSDLGCTLTCEL